MNNPGKNDFVEYVCNINRFVLPMGFVVIALSIFSKYQTTLTTILAVLFSVWMLSDGMLSFIFTKPSVKIGLQRIRESKATQVEKIKQEKGIHIWERIFSICEVSGSVGLLLFWFYIMGR